MKKIAVTLLTTACLFGLMQTGYAICGHKSKQNKEQQGQVSQNCSANPQGSPFGQPNQNNGQQGKPMPATGRPNPTGNTGKPAAQANVPAEEEIVERYESAPVSIETIVMPAPVKETAETSAQKEPSEPSEPVTMESPLEVPSPIVMQTSGISFAAMPNGAPAQQEMAAPAQAHASQIQWMTNFSEAANLAKQQNKYMLLFFTGSDWCGWCKKIDSEAFSSADFARLAGNKFVFVELDFPMNRQLGADLSQQNNQLKQKFGVTGYPTIVILDPNQNFIAETGYRPGGGTAYANYLLQLIGQQPQQ